MKSKVYFTRDISPEKVLDMFKLIDKELPGRVAVKVHSGEEGNQNYLKPEFWKRNPQLLDPLIKCNKSV